MSKNQGSDKPSETNNSSDKATDKPSNNAAREAADGVSALNKTVKEEAEHRKNPNRPRDSRTGPFGRPTIEGEHGEMLVKGLPPTKGQEKTAGEPHSDKSSQKDEPDKNDRGGERPPKGKASSQETPGIERAPRRETRPLGRPEIRGENGEIIVKGRAATDTGTKAADLLHSAEQSQPSMSAPAEQRAAGKGDQKDKADRPASAPLDRATTDTLADALTVNRGIESKTKTESAENTVAPKTIDRIDEHTGTKYSYDESNRLLSTTAKDGKTVRFEYDTNSQTPASFQLFDAAGKTLLKMEGPFDLEKQNGAITKTTDHTGAQGDYAKTITQFTADGHATVSRMDAKGHTLTRETSEPTADGIKITTRTDFAYSDATGKLTRDANSIAEDKPVLAMVRDASGNVSDRYRFETPQDAYEWKPKLHEHISHTEDAHSKTERRTTYDYSTDAQPVLTSETTRYLDTGTTKITTNQANGVEQQLTLGRDGRVEEFHRTEPDANGEKHNYTFAFKDGRISAVSKDGQEMSGPDAERLKQIGGIAAENTRQIAGVLEAPRPAEVLRPTEPRDGNSPTGTLVWKEGETYRQARVDQGQIKDTTGTSIGTINDKGEVTLSGSPATNFSIANTEGSAFHGVGTDKNRIDLVSTKEPEGFSGSLIRADGSQKYAVVAGNLYDSKDLSIDLCQRLSHDGILPSNSIAK